MHISEYIHPIDKGNSDMKRLKAIFVLFIVFSITLFSGCTIDDDFANSGVGEDGFYGVKVVYLAQDDDSATALISQYKQFVLQVMLDTYSVYGAGADTYTLDDITVNSSGLTQIVDVIGQAETLGVTAWFMSGTTIEDFASSDNVNTLLLLVMNAMLDTTDGTDTMAMARNIDHYGFLTAESQRVASAMTSAMLGGAIADDETYSYTDTIEDIITSAMSAVVVRPKAIIRDNVYVDGELTAYDDQPYLCVILMPRTTVQMALDSYTVNDLDPDSTLAFSVSYAPNGDTTTVYDISTVHGQGHQDLLNLEALEVDFTRSDLFGSNGLTIDEFTNNTPVSGTQLIPTEYAQYFHVEQATSGVGSIITYVDQSTDVLQYHFNVTGGEMSFVLDQFMAEYKI